MNAKEYERLKAEAQAEYRRKLDAIETVWKMSGGKDAQPANGSTGSVGKGALQQAVRSALLQVTGDFTLRDVYDQIKIIDPLFAEKLKDKLPSVSGTLKRMADDNELVLVETGRGKRPSKYRRKG